MKKRLTWSVESRFTRFVPLEDGQHPACIAPTITLWSGVASVGQLQQTEVIWQPEQTEWPGFSVRGFFHEDAADCEDSNSDYESRHSPHLWNLSDMLEGRQQADHPPPCTFTSSLLWRSSFLLCQILFLCSYIPSVSLLSSFDSRGNLTRFVLVRTDTHTHTHTVPSAVASILAYSFITRFIYWGWVRCLCEPCLAPQVSPGGGGDYDSISSSY